MRQQHQVNGANNGAATAAAVPAIGASQEHTIPEELDSAVDIEKGLQSGGPSVSQAVEPAAVVEESPPSVFASADMQPSEPPAHGNANTSTAASSESLQGKGSAESRGSVGSKRLSWAKKRPQRTSAMALRRQDTLPSQLRIDTGLERKSMLQRYELLMDGCVVCVCTLRAHVCAVPPQKSKFSGHQATSAGNRGCNLLYQSVFQQPNSAARLSPHDCFVYLHTQAKQLL